MVYFNGNHGLEIDRWRSKGLSIANSRINELTNYQKSNELLQRKTVNNPHFQGFPEASISVVKYSMSTEWNPADLKLGKFQMISHSKHLKYVW